ncbi:glycosyltransferase [Planctomycetota bacterium]
MAKYTAKKVAFIASFLPRKCGIATFTSDLIHNVSSASGGDFDPLVVALRANHDDKYQDPVKLEIRQNVKSDYISAADYLNFSHVDLVSVQHEFGLFGGNAGSYLSLLLRRLKAPIVTTLHTILDEPDADYRKATEEVCHCSHRVITMNERGVTMLRDIYGVPEEKIKLIAHGIPDLPFVDSNYYKHKFNLEGRRTILTFGLLSKNKGIETMLQALTDIVAADPTVMYIVLGMTHPNVLKLDGESYRFSLQQMVKDLRLENNVIFYNRFVDDDELKNFLCAADIYVTPYLSAKQLTSGTLSFAVGTGKAVVSTPYWAAEELLENGRGKLVPFGDAKRMAREVIKILQDDLVFYSMRRRAYDYGRTRTWPVLGETYWELFNTIKGSTPAHVSKIVTEKEVTSNIELPDPSLNHVIRLTDDTGMYQHASYTISNREHGYCTDDNARGVILMARYYAEYPEPHALRLLDTYLSFTLHAQAKDGSFRNFMSFDRTWLPDEPINDAFGRVLWALGTLMALPPSPSYISIVKEHFDRSIHLIPKQFPRGMAYCIIGMCDYLRQFPGASEIKRELESAADGLVHQFEENHSPGWQWFEDALTYDNGILPHALFEAGRTLSNPRYTEVAQETCDFLIEKTFNGKHFSLIGCNGWHERGGLRANFDQQPIDAASLVMMLRAAYHASEEVHYLLLQRKAFDWFLGANDVNTPLYNFRTTGCYDGLVPGGVNINQGAESTLSFLLSLLDVVDCYALLDKCRSNEGITPKISTNILDTPRKSPLSVDHVEEIR